MSKKKQVRVYSYIRFSTTAQGDEGRDSERRQTEWRDRFMAAHSDYVLDDTLYADRGVSGYSGKHRNEALGQFLGQVEAGRVPAGSILLVENIDRLTRLETTEAWDLVAGIIKRGVAVQTQIARYDQEALNSGTVHGLMAEMQRAHHESKRKSEMMRASRARARDQARSEGRVTTAMCPAWLQTCDASGATAAPGGGPVPAKDAAGFLPIPEAADTVRWIFQMRAEGLSQRHIERSLNAEATWQRPNGWRTSYIKKILSNPAVIGEYQPYTTGQDGTRRADGPPIQGYYPRVVEPELYHTVQKLLEANRGKGGRVGKKRNIFTHVAECGYCGGSMTFTDKGNPAWRYLVCDKAARGVGCNYQPVRYAEVLEVVLEGCVHLRPEQVLPDKDEHAAEAAALRDRLSGVTAELHDNERERDNFLDQIGRTDDRKLRDLYEGRIALNTERTSELEAARDKAERELAMLEHGPRSTEEWQRGVAALIDAIKPDDAVETRAKLATHLRSLIDSVQIFPLGFKAAGDPRKNLHMETGVLVKPSERVKAKGNRPRGKRGQLYRFSDGRVRRTKVHRWWDPDVDTVREVLDDAWSELATPKPGKRRWARFASYVLARRMSKEGRFYRVKFKTGERADLVPAGSLATGWSRLKTSGIEQVLPDIGSLWQDFQGSNED